MENPEKHSKANSFKGGGEPTHINNYRDQSFKKLSKKEENRKLRSRSKNVVDSKMKRIENSIKELKKKVNPISNYKDIELNKKNHNHNNTDGINFSENSQSKSENFKHKTIDCQLNTDSYTKKRSENNNKITKNFINTNIDSYNKKHPINSTNRKSYGLFLSSRERDMQISDQLYLNTKCLKNNNIVRCSEDGSPDVQQKAVNQVKFTTSNFNQGQSKNPNIGYVNHSYSMNKNKLDTKENITQNSLANETNKGSKKSMRYNAVKSSFVTNPTN